MKAVLLDLDDTLYPEIEFVKSGFHRVARYLHSRFGFGEQSLFERAWTILQKDGRGKVFDSLLQELNLYSEERAKVLVHLYRSHHPSISLYGDVLPAIRCLRQRGMRLGMVTDGMASVQRNKIAALELESLFDAIVCNDELPGDCWKPSTMPFRVILDLLGVHPQEAVYVGDNPAKDFIGPNTMGMMTIQIKRPGLDRAFPDPADKQFFPSLSVISLDEIIHVIGGKRDVD